MALQRARAPWLLLQLRLSFTCVHTGPMYPPVQRPPIRRSELSQCESCQPLSALGVLPCLLGVLWCAYELINLFPAWVPACAQQIASRKAHGSKKTHVQEVHIPATSFCAALSQSASACEAETLYCP